MKKKQQYDSQEQTGLLSGSSLGSELIKEELIFYPRDVLNLLTMWFANFTLHALWNNCYFPNIHKSV